ncbi:hypothetical protein WL92_08665 [Burkholderia multivorans]|nr:hypothetical protein WL91_20795 [Burkholderia multivorans]KWF82694.1 hypothetical protein WL92_08665 [Burkholderia multivorans]
MPHAGQKRASAGSVASQRTHARPRCTLPQRTQSRAPAAFGAPHVAQLTSRGGACVSARCAAPRPQP